MNEEGEPRKERKQHENDFQFRNSLIFSVSWKLGYGGGQWSVEKLSQYVNGQHLFDIKSEFNAFFYSFIYCIIMKLIAMKLSFERRLVQYPSIIVHYY